MEGEFFDIYLNSFNPRGTSLYGLIGSFPLSPGWDFNSARSRNGKVAVIQRVSLGKPWNPGLSNRKIDPFKRL